MLRTHIGAIEHELRAVSITMESMPGVGKSEALFQYAQMLAHRLNEPVGVVVCMLASISSADVRGFMIPMRGSPPKSVFSLPPWYPTNDEEEVDGEVTTKSVNYWVIDPSGQWYRESGWHDAMPETGIVFLDEWGQAEEDVKKPAAELQLNGNVGTHRLPIKWRVVAAQNRTSDRSGVMREMMHIINRRMLLKIDSSVPTWLQWTDEQVGFMRPHFMTVAFARQNPDIVFRDSVPDGTDPYCTPRTLCMMDRTLRMLVEYEPRRLDPSGSSASSAQPSGSEWEKELPTDDIARECAAGLIGGAAAGQFMTFLKYFDLLPTIEEIIDDPSEAKLPSGHDAQMVAAFMLAHHIDEQNADPFLKYIFRMVPEMQILSVQIVNADPKRAQFLYPLPGFQRFLTQHKDLLVGSYM
jgi:hypothetical protein